MFNKTKNNLSAMLAAVMMLTVVVPMVMPAAVSAESVKKGYLTFDKDTGMIAGCDKSASGNIMIPSEINGVAVTSIGDYAFYGCKSLTSITIPDSVTSIGAYAFCDCTGLTSITIPDSVEYISEGPLGEIVLFYGCSGLTEIIVDSENAYYSSDDGVLFNKDKTTLISYPAGKTNDSYAIPDSVTSIGDDAFSDCKSLTSITIPDSVTSIGFGAFEGCTGLTSITIPDSVEYINEGPYGEIGLFYGCSGLTSVTIGNSVTSIGENAFDGCTGLTEIIVDSENAYYSSYDGVLFDKDKTSLIRYLAGKKDASYTIPDSVTYIGTDAFDGCSSLTSITIPDSVTYIGYYAFSGCTGLTSITIPDSVTWIGEYAFSGCTGLTSLYISDLAAYLNISYDNEYSNPMCYANVLYINNERAENVVIPDGVTAIPNFAFYGCKSLTSITIPDGITKIGGHAFDGCSGLTSIYYSGTSEQWNGVTKGSDWKKNSPAVVYVFGTTTATSSKTYVSGSADGDGATGFAAELEADTVDLSNVVWTVTSGGETRRAGSLNYGGTMTGSVQIGLIVSGLYDKDATAEAAFDSDKAEYVIYTE